MKLTQCLLDMDGILSNFVKGMCDAHQLPDPYLSGELVNHFEFYEHWGMPANQFWSVATPDFWYNLEPMPYAHDIVAATVFAFGLKNVGVLTSPSKNKGCMDAKLEWIDNHFPEFNRKVTLGPAKEFSSAPYRLLIDDYDKNYESYTGSGGVAFLYPQLWNSRHAQADVAFELLNEYLESLHVGDGV